MITCYQRNMFIWHAHYGAMCLANIHTETCYMHTKHSSLNRANKKKEDRMKERTSSTSNNRISSRTSFFSFAETIPTNRDKKKMKKHTHTEKNATTLFIYFCTWIVSFYIFIFILICCRCIFSSFAHLYK